MVLEMFKRTLATGSFAIFISIGKNWLLKVSGDTVSCRATIPNCTVSLCR